MALETEFVTRELSTTVLTSSLVQVLSSVRRFFDEALPANTSGWSHEDSEGRVMATVFLDYVPLDVEVALYTEGEVTEVNLKHPTQRDILRWHRVFDLLIEFFKSHGLQVSGDSQRGSQLDCFIDDFEDDMSTGSEDNDDQGLFDAVEDVLADISLTSGGATPREESFQYLARWASSTAACREAVAQGFAKHPHLVGATLFAAAPLEEMYPAASALKNVSHDMSPKVFDILSDSQLLAGLEGVRMSELPPLVAKELGSAVHNLRIASKCKFLGDKIGEVDLSNASTAYTQSAHDGIQPEDLDDSDSDDFDDNYQTFPTKFGYTGYEAPCLTIPMMPPALLEIHNFKGNF